MWVGIAILVGFSIFMLIQSPRHKMVEGIFFFVIIATIIICITIGLIVSSADKKSKD
jgi:hypothetical protein